MARFETVLGEFINISPSDNNWRLADRTYTPPPVKSCFDPDVKSDSNIFLPPDHPEQSESLTCRVSDLMYRVASTQLEHFLVNYEHDTQRYLREGFYNMVHGWNEMADSNQDNCGFSGYSVDDKPGYVGNCLTICLSIKDSTLPSDFKSVLSTYYTFFINRFDYLCKYHSELTKFQNKFVFLIMNFSRNKRPS